MAGDYSFSRDYKINELYQPTSYKMEKASHFMDLTSPVNAKSMAMTTDPRTANQIQSLTQSINQGTNAVEVSGPLGPAEFNEIPKQHFEEMRRKAALSDVDLSMHAPIVEISGTGERGYSEMERVSSERQLMDVMDKAIMMADKKKSLPVVIHASAGAGSTYTYKTEDGKRKKDFDTLVAVDRLTGELTQLKESVDFYPMTSKENDPSSPHVRKVTKSPLKKIDAINDTKWDNEIKKIKFEEEKVHDKIFNIPKELELGIIKGEVDPSTSPEAAYAHRAVEYASSHLEEAEQSTRSAFSRAYEILKEDGSKEAKEKMEFLNKASEKYSEILKIKDGKITSEDSMLISRRLEANSLLTDALSKVTPKQFIPVEEFSIKKGSQTLANVALHAYKKAKKAGKKTPTIAVENLYQGMGFSQAKDLNKLIEKTHEEFVKKATENGILKKEEAEKKAKEMIGVTFDVGHLNISRKYGFTDEDIKKEAKEFAKYVKHLHITDNFGYSDSHLPIGMGNVPMKAIFEVIQEVQGEDALSKMRKVNEVGGWFKNFQTSPYVNLLEATGSPIYSSGTGPTWDTRGGFQQSYMQGYGMMLPDTHYQQFGAGFSQLPLALGGSRAKQSNRMGGGV